MSAQIIHMFLYRQPTYTRQQLRYTSTLFTAQLVHASKPEEITRAKPCHPFISNIALRQTMGPHQGKILIQYVTNNNPISTGLLAWVCESVIAPFVSAHAWDKTEFWIMPPLQVCNLRALHEQPLLNSMNHIERALMLENQYFDNWTTITGLVLVPLSQSSRVDASPDPQTQACVTGHEQVQHSSCIPPEEVTMEKQVILHGHKTSVKITYSTNNDPQASGLIDWIWSQELLDLLKTADSKYQIKEILEVDVTPMTGLSKTPILDWLNRLDRTQAILNINPGNWTVFTGLDVIMT